MDEPTETTGQERPVPSSQKDLVVWLYEKIARLHASVQSLRRTSEDLEADRQRLLEENRALRRRITVSTLIDDLEQTIEPVDTDRAQENVPPPAKRLYHDLPDRFSFPHFFQVAEDAQLDTATARRCLAHYLTNGALVQSGAYLEKSGGSLRELD